MDNTKSLMNWNKDEVAKDLRSRHVVKMCRDGIRRNSLRSLTPEERMERFMDRVKKLPNGCWQWLGAVTGSKSKYGMFLKDGKLIRAHRFSYEEFNHTKIPEGLIARHSCDNRLCVNPEHILVGTTQDNVNDKMSRGRHRYGTLRGEASGKSVVKNKQILKLMELSKKGLIQIELSRLTGISISNVGAILQGRTWNHITGFKKPSKKVRTVY